MRYSKAAAGLLAIAMLLAGCAGPQGPAGQADATPPIEDLPPAELPPAELPPAELPPVELPGEETPPIGPLPEEQAPVQFTDSLEREHTLPQPLSRVAPGNMEAQMALFSLAPERMAGWYRLPEDAPAYLGEAYTKLPALCGADGGLDSMAVRQTGAEALLLMGGKMEAGELDALQQEAGIPVLFIESQVESLAQAYFMLGGLFGMEETAEEYVEYFEVAVEGLQKGAASISESGRKSVYIASGPQGLTPAGSGALALSGAKNAVAEAGIGKEISMELLQRNIAPDVILAVDDATYAAVKDGEKWNTYEPVQMGLYYAPPTMLLRWLGEDTPAPAQLVAAKWLMSLLYPEAVAYDMAEEVKLYYDMFFHIQMTDAQAAEQLQKSTLKPIG